MGRSTMTEIKRNYVMNKNQRVAFWSIFIGFCVAATAAIYPQGAFENLSVGGALILTTCYLVVAVLIRWYVKSNPSTIEKWFQ